MRSGLTLDGLRWAFTTTNMSNWHPLQWISLQLDHDLYGLNAGGYHLTNVLLHAANTALLCWVLWRMTGALVAAGFVAALFALHPLHVESVAWISERKDVLSTFFAMLVLLAYVRYVERPGWVRSALVAIFLALGLMAKPMLVTLPGVLLLLDYWPLARLPDREWRRVRRLLLEKIPLFGLAMASGVLTYSAQKTSGALGTLEDVPFAPRSANAVRAYTRYLQETLWPRGLAAFYPLLERSWTDWRIWGSAAALLVVTAGAVWQVRRRPYLCVGWFWYLGTLIPVIGLIQVGEQSHADRYTYIPLIGIFIAAVWLAADVARRRPAWSRRMAALGVVLLVACAIATVRQIRFWRDGTALWERVLAVSGPHRVTMVGLAGAYAEQGDYARAIPLLKFALDNDPTDENVRRNLAFELLIVGDIEASAREFQRTLTFQSADADQHLQHALAARAAYQRHETLGHLACAASLRPDDPLIQSHLAMELFVNEEYAAARRHFREAVRLNPSLRQDRGIDEAMRLLDALPSKHRSR